MQTALLWAAGGTGLHLLDDHVGRCVGFFSVSQAQQHVFQRIFLGFAAGVMIAASVWSLLIPAIERAEEAGQVGWIPAASGFAIAWRSSWCCTSCCRTCIRARASRGPAQQMGSSPTLLFTAVTLHNIPEGMSVGLLFAMHAQNGGDPAMFGMAGARLSASGTSNVPEGAAVALPIAAGGHERTEGVRIGSAVGFG